MEKPDDQSQNGIDASDYSTTSNWLSKRRSPVTIKPNSVGSQGAHELKMPKGLREERDGANPGGVLHWDDVDGLRLVHYEGVMAEGIEPLAVKWTSRKRRTKPKEKPMLTPWPVRSNGPWPRSCSARSNPIPGALAIQRQTPRPGLQLAAGDMRLGSP